jgi:DNA polymerase IV
MLRSLFVDFNSYFASVEQQINPSLRGKPVIVVPVEADTTCAIAASYEARPFGIKTGTIVADAKRLCPDLIMVRAHHSIYIDYHHRLVAAVDSVIPVKRVVSIDEMVCDLHGRQRNRDAALGVAAEVKDTIAATVGEELRCSIGIAPNDFLAKTASDMEKPDGLVLIEQHDLPHILHSLQLQDITGIGRKMLQRLYRKGLYTVEQLCAAPKEKLRDVWGGIEGERMYAKLRGEMMHVQASTKTTVGHSHVLEPSLRTINGSEAVLHRLLQKAAMRLRQYGLVTGNIAVSIRATDGHRYKADAMVTSTQDTVQLTAVLAKLLRARTDRHTIPIKVSVSLNCLSPAESTPVPMFENTGPARQPLNDALDALNKKYGKNTLYVGSAHMGKDSAPMRIAFTHIPDLETDEDE